MGCVEGAEEGTVEGCELGPVEGACVTGDLKHDLLNDFNIYCYHVRTCAFTLKVHFSTIFYLILSFL